MSNNNQPQQQHAIHYSAHYVPERKTVVLSVSSVAAMEIPFEILKKFYYEMDKTQKAAQSQLIVPDKQIIRPRQ
jgi:hypothetical protein